MSILLTEAEIAALISEPKQLEPGFQSKLQLRPKHGHKERELEITGANGSEFRLILRQSLFNILDFSAILVYSGKSSSRAFRLRRYNGKSHEHTNKMRVRPSMIFTFTSPRSDISIRASERTPMLKQQIDTATSKAR